MQSIDLRETYAYRTSKKLICKKDIKYKYNKTYIDLQDFINLYKTCTVKPYSFLVIDTTLASDNLLRFRKNLLEII